MIQLVFATTEEGHFGADKGMPWRHISQDFKNFKDRTEGTSLIMGAKTFASLPGKLPGRIHYVLTDRNRPSPVAKNGDIPDILICEGNLKSILENAHKYDREYSIIGGADLLAKALPFADRVIMTTIYDDYDHNLVTQTLSDRFLFEIETEWAAIERHYHRISFYTQIEECVLVKAEKLK